MIPTEQQLAHRAQWLAALRSGPYKQGRSWLCRDGRYCCIGVAAELAGELYSDPCEGIERAGLKRAKHNHCGGSVGYEWFAERFGVDRFQAGHIVGKSVQDNDVYCYDFPAIADRLELRFQGERCPHGD